VHRDGAQCRACWQKDPDRPFVYVAGLIDRLDEPPEWLADFAGYAAARFCPSRAVGLLRDLGRLIDAGVTRPPALLAQACWNDRSIGPLARTLEGFFVDRHLALPLAHAEQLEKQRRTRRIQATPEPFRAAAAAFADAQLAARQRARRAGTRPRSHSTIDTALCAIRDFARFLTDQHPAVGGWETVSVDHVEAFLALRPASQPRRLGALRVFLTWARKHRLVLVDPTRGLRITERRGFKGPVIDSARQQALFRRWTGPDIHPHEAFVGLMALLHAACTDELRHLRIADIDRAAHAISLGQRPHLVPLDPATWAALTRCLDHHAALRTLNEHVLVTKITATRPTAASPYYLTHLLDPADVSVRALRSNRLAHLVATTDPLLIISALGLTPAAATWYLRDTVDIDRLANL
jgi:site-specific recombinase XerD